MTEPVRIVEISADVVALVLDAGKDPFTFSSERLGAFERALELLEARRDLHGLLVRAVHPSTFCAGADVDEIAGLKDKDAARSAVGRGQAAFLRLSKLPYPTVALVHGAALGGGCELALACTARTATAKTKIGLPEVQLGILPAWGGSTRLPRLIGLLPAIELITAGRTLNAYRALKSGLVDSIVAPEHLEREGLRLIAGIRTGRPPVRPRPPLMKRLPVAFGFGRSFVGGKARTAILKETKGFYPAPLAALDVLLGQVDRRETEGFALELERVTELLFSPVAKELVRLFKLTRDGARPSVYAAANSAPPIRSVAVIGAGVMGAGIAQTAALRGFATRVIDKIPASLVRCRAVIAAEIKKKVARRDLEPHQARRMLAGLTFSTSLDGLRGVDLVIEAAPERRDIKDQVLRAVAAAVGPDAIIATNTSSFPLADLATSVLDPQRFVGIHFFNPAPKMPLVEVVCGPNTTESVVERAVKFAKDLGKTPLVVADGPGFLVNRLLAPYLADACKLAAEGVSITAIDADLEAFGMPMGPFTLMDTVGLDVLKDVGDHLAARGGAGVHPLVLKLAEAGRFGRKSGRGFYAWNKDGRRGAPDPTAVPTSGAALPPIGSIAKRLIDVMLAEARAALADGLVPTAEEIDLGTIFGIGFPAFRGGLMRHAANGDAS